MFCTDCLYYNDGIGVDAACDNCDPDFNVLFTPALTVTANLHGNSIPEKHGEWWDLSTSEDVVLSSGQKRYLAETKPRQAARGKTKPMQIMSKYRNHLCELHTDENGVRRCITGKCPLSFSTCYNNESFADYWNSSSGVTKRKTKEVIKEQMKLENWPDLDKL